MRSWDTEISNYQMHDGNGEEEDNITEKLKTMRRHRGFQGEWIWNPCLHAISSLRTRYLVSLVFTSCLFLRPMLWDMQQLCSDIELQRFPVFHNTMTPMCTISASALHSQVPIQWCLHHATMEVLKKRLSSQALDHALHACGLPFVLSWFAS